jgi:hypothetical protein
LFTSQVVDNIHAAISKNNRKYTLTFLKLLVVITVFIGIRAPMPAQELPSCAWPIETTGTGLTNVAYPDTSATYWTMPFDSVRWKAMIVTGTYPDARFFSFVSYVATGASVDSLVDLDINPDPENTNPFRPGSAAGPHNYSVTISRDDRANYNNYLALGDSRLAWVIYRVYVPNKGLDREGGVDLPAVTLVGRDGSTRPIPSCAFSDLSAAAQAVTMALDSNGFGNIAKWLERQLAQLGDKGGAAPVCQPEPLVSWIPKNTGGYFPNPANKYIATPGLCFQPNRIVVVRGKGAIVPDTYNGTPVWQPPGIQMRYWSMCNNNQHAPFPVVACQPDLGTKLDAEGFYTYVLSRDESATTPPEPPSWLPSGATWLPWGSLAVSNILIFRNMLPESDFNQTVQTAIEDGCVVNNQRGVTPPRAEVVREGECAHAVMGDYYPTAVYCDKQLFIAQGLQGCFAAASAASAQP